MLFNFKQKTVTGGYKPTRSAKYRSVNANYDLSNAGGGGNFNVSRYNGTSQDMAAGSIANEWMPRDPVGLHALWRQIYAHDAIAGPAVDLISNIPWSDFDLMGVKDPGQLKIFESAMDNLQVETLLTPLTTEYLVIGRISGSLIFDEEKGTWTGFMPHDPDFINITPIPISNVDPKLDMRLSPGLKKMFTSNDPRDLEALKLLPDNLIQQMKGGKIELDPLNTLFVPRRTLLNDHVGTSLYTRLVAFHALEQNLLSGTLIASRRRQRSVLHLSIGLEDVWEPEPEEIDDIINLFMQADEDPQGAIVGTRKGVEVQEVRDGSNFWKISDEIQFLNDSKMKALSINEAFLSGDANYANMEVALSVFIEMIRNLRENLTRRIFYHKIFPTLSRVYGLRKINKNEIEHRIRIKKSVEEQEQDIQKEVARTTAFADANAARERLTYQQALKDARNGQKIQKIKAAEAENIPQSELLIPQIHWHKQLRPEADENYLNVLGTLEEKGLPIPLRTWAAAGGIDLQKMVDMLKEDGKIRKEIQDWKRSATDQDQAAFASTVISTKKAMTKSLPLFRRNQEFMGVTAEVAAEYIDSFDALKYDMLYQPEEVEADLNRYFDGNTHRVDAMKFIMKRVGMVNFPMKRETMSSAVDQLSKSGLTHAELMKEVQVINRYSRNGKPVSGNTPQSITSQLPQDALNSTKSSDSSTLYSGL